MDAPAASLVISEAPQEEELDRAELGLGHGGPPGGTHAMGGEWWSSLLDPKQTQQATASGVQKCERTIITPGIILLRGGLSRAVCEEAAQRVRESKMVPSIPPDHNCIRLRLNVFLSISPNLFRQSRFRFGRQR
jgi:hypothetical protein